MGFLTSLFGCTQSDGNGDDHGRYVTEKSFHENLENHAAMSPQTVAQLREHGVTNATELKLEYFFYTDTEAKAQSLAGPLTELNYEVETGQSGGDARLFLVTGWTTPIKMDEDTAIAWTKQMCLIGYEHDCEFDGWGTNPQQ
jgi:hypothetical protein